MEERLDRFLMTCILVLLCSSIVVIPNLTTLSRQAITQLCPEIGIAGQENLIEDTEMRITLMTMLCLICLFTGCLHRGSQGTYCDITISNRSSLPISSVTLDPDGRSSDFGFFTAGGGHATVAFYYLSFTDNFSIQWKESGLL